MTLWCAMAICVEQRLSIMSVAFVSVGLSIVVVLQWAVSKAL